MPPNLALLVSVKTLLRLHLVSTVRSHQIPSLFLLCQLVYTLQGHQKAKCKAQPLQDQWPRQSPPSGLRGGIIGTPATLLLLYLLFQVLLLLRADLRKPSARPPRAQQDAHFHLLFLLCRNRLSRLPTRLNRSQPTDHLLSFPPALAIS
jgi:hypothetical protein